MSTGKNISHFLRAAFIAGVSFVALAGSASAGLELPLLGENAALNLKKEDQIGRGLYLRLKNKGYVIEDKLLSRYLSDIGESLLTSLNFRSRDYLFYLVKDGSVNAFATPGGYIGVHAGLVSMSRTEDELASVLAHEIAHVELMHGMQMLEKAQDINLASMISILAAILVSSQDSELAGALVYTGAAGSAQSMVNFTRANEYEADRVGIELLKKSDYDAAAMADFMQLLQSREQAGELSRIEYIRTHPVNSNRIAEIQARTQRIERGKNKNRRFDQFKDYLLYLYPELSYSGEKSEFFKALQLTRNGQLKQAESIYRTLIERDPDSIWYSYALAENLDYQGRLDESAQLYKSLLLLYPDDLAIGARLAKAYMKQSRYESALNIAERLVNDHESETLVYQLQVEIFTALSKDAYRQLAEANYHWFNGNRELAEKLFKALLARGVLDAGREEGIKLKLDQK